MKTLSVIFSLILSSHVWASEKSHHHGAHETSNTALHLDHGKKWPTDKILRKNMSELHAHVKKNIAIIDNKSMTLKQYQTLGKDIGENINDIFKNCKLPPKADAQLHIIMAGLVGANKTLMDASSKEEKRTAIAQIVMNYKNYLKYFDSAGE